MLGFERYAPILVLGSGRALRVGVGIAAALLALILADASPRAESRPGDGGRIVFGFGESGALHPAQLAVMNGDGSQRRSLPLDHIFGLSWSPDGRSIAFEQSALWKRPDVYRPNIWTMNVDGRPRFRRVLRNGGGPDWSPDGRSIAFERGKDIWVVDVGDHRQRRVVRHGSEPVWSPDGRMLAFERARGRSCLPLSCVGRADVWVRDLTAHTERRLARHAHFPRWSPDGRQIVFHRWRRQGDEFEPFVYVMRADGTRQHRLFEGEQPLWAPNGREIAFVGGHYHDAIIRARLDGSRRRVLFAGGGCFLLDWGPRG